jgi:uncharacterized surface protein with fasciclin (FAS1) repeats
MTRSFKLRSAAVLVAALSLVAAACGDDDSDDASADTTAAEETTETTMADDTDDTDDTGDGAAADPAETCDTDAIVEAVEGGSEEGTLEGMTDDPVATAASNNPVLTTLTAAVGEAGLVDTLNTADALTVFAPTDCAFAALDSATLDAALADPSGLLTQVLGFHVIPGEQLSAENLASETQLTSFDGTMLPVEADGEEITLNSGQATVVVPDIQTANATVHLIDNVMLPPEG